MPESPANLYAQMRAWQQDYAARNGKAPTRELWAQRFSQITGAPIQQGMDFYDWGVQYHDTTGQWAGPNEWGTWMPKLAGGAAPPEEETSPYQQMTAWVDDFRTKNGRNPTREEGAQRLSLLTGISLDQAGQMYDKSVQYGGRAGEAQWNAWLQQVAPGAGQTPTLDRDKFNWQKEQDALNRQQNSEQYWAGLLASQTGPRDWLRYQITQSQLPESARRSGNMSVKDIANATPAFGGVTADPSNSWESAWQNWRGVQPVGGGSVGSGSLPDTLPVGSGGSVNLRTAGYGGAPAQPAPVNIGAMPQRSPEQYAIDQAYNKARSDYARANGLSMTEDFQPAPPGWQPGMGYTPQPRLGSGARGTQPGLGAGGPAPSGRVGYIGPPVGGGYTGGRGIGYIDPSVGGTSSGPTPVRGGGTGVDPNIRPQGPRVAQPINISPRDYAKMSPTARAMQEGEWSAQSIDPSDAWAKMKNAWATGSGGSIRARWR